MGGGGDRSFSFGDVETPRTPRETAAAPPGAAGSPGMAAGDWRRETQSGSASPAAGDAGIDFRTPAAFRRSGAGAAPAVGMGDGSFDGMGEGDLSFGPAGSSFGGGGASGTQR